MSLENAGLHGRRFMVVIKRSGVKVEFDKSKIIAAVNAAGGNGLDIADKVVLLIDNDSIKVEDIQDLVEIVLMQDDPETAKRYILYRHERTFARTRRLHPDPNAIPDYIHPAKYGKYLPDKKRRETWLETSNRCMLMHTQRFPELATEIVSAWRFVDEKRVLPSSRSLQFGGSDILRHNARMYNCCFTHIDRPRAFQESFYLLLCGCGVGISVQRTDVQQLPIVKGGNLTLHYSVYDSIEGWADAFGLLLDSYFTGFYVEFSYEKIRPEGASLISGGKAPGHRPLKILLEKVRLLLDIAIGRHLKSVECHDIICHAAEAVLAGGIRRSSLISLFSVDDDEMMYAKSASEFDYIGKNTQRAMANNSAIISRGDRKAFDRVVASQYNGEPGFIFLDNTNYGTNPCGEILLNPLPGGFGFCNLTEINGRLVTSKEDFFDAVRAATIIGTLQATYTDFPYLGKASEETARQEALLGVSITGIMENPDILLDPETLRAGAQIALVVNLEWSQILCINLARRITTIKPSGTASLNLGTSPGIHPHHARRYFRRIIANRNEAVAQWFVKHNPHMVEVKPNGDLCLTFPVEVSDKALTVKDLDTEKFLDAVFTVYDNWIVPGSRRGTHNVSCTVVYDPPFWESLMDIVWDNRRRIQAMSFLPRMADKGIPYIPREEILDEDLWQNMLRKYKKVDYSQLMEHKDDTSVLYSAACSSGECEIANLSVADGSYLLEDHNSGDLSVMGRLLQRRLWSK